MKNNLSAFILGITLILLTTGFGWTQGAMRAKHRQEPATAELNYDYTPDSEFKAVYLQMLQKAWAHHLSLNVPKKFKRIENYDFAVKEESTFFRVELVPHQGKNMSLGGGTTNGVEVMYIFDKKTLSLKYCIGVG